MRIRTHQVTAGFVLVVLAFGARAQLTSAPLSVAQSGYNFVVTPAGVGTTASSGMSDIMSRTYVPGTSAVAVSENVKITGPAGDLTVKASRSLLNLDVARSLGKAVAKNIGPIAVALAVAEVLDNAGIKNDNGTPKLDRGNPEIEQTGLVYQFGDGSWNRSPSGACSSAAGAVHVANRSYAAKRAWLDEGGAPWCIMTITEINGEDTNTYDTSPFQGSSKLDKYYACPNIIDPGTGESYEPGKLANGKCMSGAYSAASEQEFIDAVTPAINQTNSANVAKDIVTAGEPIPSTGISLTGPSSQTGKPVSTTTTSATGTKTETKTPTYNYTYNNNSVSYTITNSTVTNNTNPTTGESSTETKTEEAPEDTSSFCKLYPESIACAKLGTAPEPEAVPIDKKQIQITPDIARWRPSAGSCSGGNLTLSTGVTINLFEGFCSFFALLKGVIIGFCGLAGAFLFKGGIR